MTHLRLVKDPFGCANFNTSENPNTQIWLSRSLAQRVCFVRLGYLAEREPVAKQLLSFVLQLKGVSAEQTSQLNL